MRPFLSVFISFFFWQFSGFSHIFFFFFCSPHNFYRAMRIFASRLRPVELPRPRPSPPPLVSGCCFIIFLRLVSPSPHRIAPHPPPNSCFSVAISLALYIWPSLVFGFEGDLHCQGHIFNKKKKNLKKSIKKRKWVGGMQYIRILYHSVCVCVFVRLCECEGTNDK